MTYEEKMLSIFSRYRGQPLDPALVSRIQDDCEREVWVHLPPGIRESWKLTLAIGESGNLELRPKQLKKGIVGELESALISEFRERGRKPSSPVGGEKKISSEPEKKGKEEEEEPRGGIAAINFAFGAPDVPEVARPDAGESSLANRSTEPMRPKAASGSKKEISEAGSGIGKAGSEISDAALIETMARDLGISLPPNASLLGPFLVALTKAHEFKQRAEIAEAKLEQLTRLVQGQD